MCVLKAKYFTSSQAAIRAPSGATSARCAAPCELRLCCPCLGRRRRRRLWVWLLLRLGRRAAAASSTPPAAAATPQAEAVRGCRRLEGAVLLRKGHPGSAQPAAAGAGRGRRRCARAPHQRQRRLALAARPRRRRYEARAVVTGLAQQALGALHCAGRQQRPAEPAQCVELARLRVGQRRLWSDGRQCTSGASSLSGARVGKVLPAPREPWLSGESGVNKNPPPGAPAVRTGGPGSLTPAPAAARPAAAARGRGGRAPTPGRRWSAARRRCARVAGRQ